METLKPQSKSTLLSRVRGLVLPVIITLSGCSTLDVEHSINDTYIDDLPPATPSCTQDEMRTEYGDMFEFLFNQESTVGLGDTDHDYRYRLSKKLNEEYCGIVAANEVKDVFLEEEAHRQYMIDAFMNGKISENTLKEILVVVFEGYCHETSRTAVVKASADAAFYAKAKADGVNIHFIDPPDRESEKAIALRQEFVLMGGYKLMAMGCDIYNYDVQDKLLTTKQILKLYDYEEENDRLRDMDDADLMEAYKEHKQEGENALIVYGNAHFDSLEDFSTVAVSAGFYYSRSHFNLVTSYDAVPTDYAIAPKFLGFDHEFSITSEGSRRGYKPVEPSMR